MGKNKDDLTRIGPGLYMDEECNLYVLMREFLDAYHMPDRLEVRAVVWDEIRMAFREFEDITIIEILAEN